MNAVTIFMEGGGPRGASRDRLRRGMEVFLRELREAARAHSWRWQLTCCGDRGRAFNKFKAASDQGEPGLLILLVDSEDPVTAATARCHLQQRDKWPLECASDHQVHLMVQTMETWIVADRQALAEYFGEGFALDALPKENLEAVSKDDIAAALRKAVRSTKGRTYRKLRDGSALLRRIDAETVRQHCPACRRLFDTLAKEIGRQ